MQLEGVGALRTEVAARDRRPRIALDRDQLAVLVKDHLSATDAAVRTDGAREFCVLILGKQRASTVAHRFDTGTIAAVLIWRMSGQRCSRSLIIVSSELVLAWFRSGGVNVDEQLNSSETPSGTSGLHPGTHRYPKGD